MNKYTLTNIVEELKNTDLNYISFSDIISFLLSNVDSLLYKSILLNNCDPVSIRDEINSLRPNSKYLEEDETLFISPFVEKMIKNSLKSKDSSEYKLTEYILESKNVLTYQFMLKNIEVEDVYRQLKDLIYQFENKILNKGRNLTNIAINNKLKVAYERENEIQFISKLLMISEYKIPVLIGDCGIGKNSIIEGLAAFLITKNSPQILKKYTIVEFPDITEILTKDFSDTIKDLTDEISRSQDIILYFKDFNSLLINKKIKKAFKQVIIPIIKKKEIKVVINSTSKNNKKLINYFGKKHLKMININELNSQKTYNLIIKSKEKIFEEKYNIPIADKYIKLAVDLSEQFLGNKINPKKSMDLIEYSILNAIKENVELSEEVIFNTLSEFIGFDFNNIVLSKYSNLQYLNEEIKKEVLDQDNSIDQILKKIKLSYNHISKKTKPLVFMLVGEIGVGKRYFSKVLSEKLFGTGRFYDAHINSLTDNFEKMVSFVEKNPFSVILLEEFDLAHSKLIDKLEIELEKDLYNNCIIMFSSYKYNTTREKKHPFLGEPVTKFDKSKYILSNFTNKMKDLIDDVVYFNNISEDTIRTICWKKMNDTVLKYNELFTIQIKKNCLDFLCKKITGNSIKEIQKIVENELEFKIVEFIFTEGVNVGAEISVCVIDEEISVLEV